jgi:hypothetical protein
MPSKRLVKDVVLCGESRATLFQLRKWKLRDFVVRFQSVAIVDAAHLETD